MDMMIEAFDLDITDVVETTANPQLAAPVTAALFCTASRGCE
jgi:hypothetical protein